MALLVLMPSLADASGIILYELGTRDVGLASAGWAARADDAATLFRNPAGMSRLSGPQATLAGQLLYGDLGFSPDATTTVSGSDGGNPVGALPGGSGFFVNSLPSGLGLGLGVFSYFGLASEYEQGWVGRYYIQKATLLGLTVMPAVSYRFNDWLSAGAGLNVMFGVFDQEVGIPSLGAQPDGLLKVKDSTQGFGANLGALIEADDKTRFGATYLSQVSLDFEDIPEFSGLSNLMEGALTRNGIIGSSLDLGLNVPQTVMVSFFRDVCSEWSLMGNVGWQNWEKFGKVDISLADTLASVTADRKYQDTWHAALGAEWATSPRWTLSGGVAYDGSPVEDEDRTLDFPVGKTYRFGAGARVRTSEKVQIGLGYTLAWVGDLPVHQSRGPLSGRVVGDFTGTAIHTVGVNLEWKL